MALNNTVLAVFFSKMLHVIIITCFWK